MYINVINELRRLCFWRCSIVRTDFGKLPCWQNIFLWGKLAFWSDRLLALRVCRSVTKLTVHWALQLFLKKSNTGVVLKHRRKKQRVLMKKQIFKRIMFEINILGARKFKKVVRVYKVVQIWEMLYYWHCFFWKSEVFFLKKMENCKK